MIDLAFASLRALPLVLLGLLLVRFGLRKRSAAARHEAIRVLLVAAAIMPVVASVLTMALRVPVATISPRAVQAAPAWVPFTVLPDDSWEVRTPARTERAARHRSEIDAIFVSTAVHIVVMSALFVPGIFASRRLRRIERTATILEPRGKTTILRATDPGLRVPLTYGSKIILPADSADWPEVRLRTALLHEEAHIERSDWTWIQFARFLSIALWFNPGFLLLTRALRATAEEAADDAVLAGGVLPSDYARELLAVSARVGGFDGVTLAMVGRGGLKNRLHAILSPTRDRRRATLLFGATAAVLAGAATLALGSFTTRMARLTMVEPKDAVVAENGVARLHDGSTLELITIQSVDRDRVDSWNLLGFPATEMTDYVSQILAGEGPGRNVDFRLRFRTKTKDELQVAVRLPTEFQGYVAQYGTENPNLSVHSRLEGEPLSTSLTVGIAPGPWEPDPRRIDPSSGSLVRDGAKGETFVPMALPADNDARALLLYAVTSRKRVLWPRTASPTGPTFVVPAGEEIRAIEVRHCAWQWVAFHDVPLVPNAEARKNGGRPIVKRRVLHEGAGKPDTIVYDVVGVQK